MSMYADYIKERLGDDAIETEEGFCTYRYLDHGGESAVYIIDIYVRPFLRKGSVASDLADRVAAIAKEKGCKVMIGTVVPSAKGSTDSLRVLLGYGMQLDSASQNLIIFKKGI